MQHPILKQHPEQAGKAVLAEHEVVFLRDGAIPDNLRSFNSRAYKQFGNSVVVDVMEHMAKLMAPFI